MSSPALIRATSYINYTMLTIWHFADTAFGEDMHIFWKSMKFQDQMADSDVIFSIVPGFDATFLG